MRISWNVSVITSSPYDVNQDGYINEADLEVISAHFGEVTAAPYPRYDVIGHGIVVASGTYWRRDFIIRM